MSRIGRLPVAIPAGVEVSVAAGNVVTVKGPKGTLERALPTEMEIEPTGALDTASGEQVMELFHELHKTGVTIVMITHELEIAQHAERILTIRDGRLGEEQVG